MTPPRRARRGQVKAEVRYRRICGTIRPLHGRLTHSCARAFHAPFGGHQPPQFGLDRGWCGPLRQLGPSPNGGRTELWFRRRLSAVRPPSFGCWTSLIDSLEPRPRPGLFPKCDATTSNDDRPGAKGSRSSGSAHCRVQGPYRSSRRTRAANSSTRATY